jgi:hypothetical protein
MTNQDQLVEISENDIAIVGLRKDGIVHIFYKDHAVVDIKGVNSMLETYKTFLPPGKFPFLIESGEYVVFQDEGRNYTIEIEHKVPSLKSAIVVDNVGYQLVANHYINSKKPKTKYGVFKDFDEAVEWLKE